MENIQTLREQLLDDFKTDDLLRIWGENSRAASNMLTKLSTKGRSAKNKEGSFRFLPRGFKSLAIIERRINQRANVIGHLDLWRQLKDRIDMELFSHVHRWRWWACWPRSAELKGSQRNLGDSSASGTLPLTAILAFPDPQHTCNGER